MPRIGELTGEVIAERYELQDLLGQGSFGAVYRAWDQRRLRPPQAIKILYRDRFANPRTRERFLREAELLAQLNHSHIVSINDFGIDLPCQRAYLVMPYVNGGTMQDFLGQLPGPLGIDEILDLLRQVCDALDYMHTAQIAHLDLKPQNILRYLSGDLLVADFGLAHRLVGEHVRGGSSMRMGTPYYMAPEHFDGKPERRSDLYAIGVLLYRLLAGTMPFGGTPLQVMAGHQFRQPRSLLAFRPELSPAIDDVMRVALAKRPEHRYATAGALLAAATDALMPPAPRRRAAQCSSQPSATVDPFAPTEQAALLREPPGRRPPVVINLAARVPVAAPPPLARSTFRQTLSFWIQALRWLQYVAPVALRFLLPALLSVAAHAGLQWAFWMAIFPFLQGQVVSAQVGTSLWVGLGVGALCGLLAIAVAKEIRASYGFAEEAPGWRYLNYASSGLAWLSGAGLVVVVGHGLNTWVHILEDEWFVAIVDVVFLCLGVFSFSQHDLGMSLLFTLIGTGSLAGAWAYYFLRERGW